MNPKQFKHIGIFAFAALLYVVSVSGLLQVPLALGLGLAVLALPTVLLAFNPKLRCSHRRMATRPSMMALPFVGAVLAALAAGLPGVWPMAAGAVLAVVSVAVLGRLWPTPEEPAAGNQAAA